MYPAQEEICREFEQVYPVNYNCPGQLTVAAAAEEFKAFSARIKEAGGRALPLKVAGGFHSPFMEQASMDFGKLVRTIEFNTPEIPLYSNGTGRPYEGDYAKLLEDQINHPVRWQAIVEDMIARGVDTFIEAGPGETLCGFVKKIDSGVKAVNVEELL